SAQKGPAFGVREPNADRKGCVGDVISLDRDPPSALDYDRSAVSLAPVEDRVAGDFDAFASEQGQGRAAVIMDRVAFDRYVGRLGLAVGRIHTDRSGGILIETAINDADLLCARLDLYCQRIRPWLREADLENRRVGDRHSRSSRRHSDSGPSASVDE